MPVKKDNTRLFINLTPCPPLLKKERGRNFIREASPLFDSLLKDGLGSLSEEKIRTPVDF
jgi:hypothetical protein